ncbi:MAG TPA: pentapeptide repeat-containing protein [Kofleriaceae bacterium]|jgi:uncharacterized protein YjbI with pentapeptide repeats
MSIPVIGYTRSSSEVDFWLRLHGCPQCGSHELGETQMRGYGRYMDVAGQPRGAIMGTTCPRCGFHRDVQFYMHPAYDTCDVRELGGPMPSTIITPLEFATEMRRALALVPVAFERLSDQERRAIAAERALAYKSAVELLKFIPAGASEVPDALFGDDLAYKRAHASELTRAYLEEKAAYLTDYLERMYALAERAEAAKAATGVVEPRRRLPIPAFSLASLKLHEQWVLHGEVGENQPLIAHAADATEMKLSARNLSKAEMDKVTLDRADLSYATLDGARLVDVSFRGASLENASAYEASFVGCHFEGLDAFLFKLRATRFERCDFTGANLMRSVWTQCAITTSAFTGVDLRNARLDEAVFTDCDLRDADLSVPEPGVNTARGARFVRCDLRGAKWDGRDLDGVEFVDCRDDPGTAPPSR